jgi:hypothetical protein
MARCFLRPIISMVEDLNNISPDIADDIDEAIKQYAIYYGLNHNNSLGESGPV